MPDTQTTIDDSVERYRVLSKFKSRKFLLTIIAFMTATGWATTVEFEKTKWLYIALGIAAIGVYLLAQGIVDAVEAWGEWRLRIEREKLNAQFPPTTIDGTPPA